MKGFLKHNAVYFFLYLLLLAYLADILLHHGKVQIHQYINGYVGNAYVDTFFKYVNELGDGLFAICLIIILVFNNVRKAMFVLISYSSASLLTTILKNFVFIEHWRPAFVYKWFLHIDLHTVYDVNMNTGGNSFPSGHATAAFAVFISLLLMSKNQFLKFLFFILAILASFSRTYLSQHWLVDIYFGSIIGFGFALATYVLFYTKSYSNKFNSSLQVLLSKKNKNV
jgi:membrane-associated phospholipid phosphatase